jgi:uncharacterized protein involved in outer membrane biogenesis
LNIYVRGALIFVVLLAAALFFGPMLIDWNRYRPELEAWLTAQSGHKVNVEGSLSVRILPQPRLALTKVTVGEGKAHALPALVSLKSLDLRIGILPLFTGRIVVTELRLGGAMLSLERRADGTLNLGQWDALGQPRRVLAGFSPIPQGVAIERVEIADGTLAYHDAPRDWRETVSDIDLTAVTLGDQGPYRARGAFSWAGRSWTGAVELGARQQAGNRPLTVFLEMPDIGLKATLSGRYLGPGRDGDKPISWQASGALSLQVNEAGKLLGLPASGSTQALLMLDGAVSASDSKAAIKDAALRWGDFGAGVQAEIDYAAEPTLALRAKGNAFNLDAALPDLAQAAGHPYWPLGMVGLMPAAASGAPPQRGLFSIFKGDVDLSLDALVFAQGRVDKPALSASFAQGALQIKDLGAVLPGEAELHVNGTYDQSGFKGKAALAGERARELFAWWAIPVAGIEDGRLLHIAYLGGFEIGSGALKFSDFEAGLDGSAVKGSLALSRAADGPPHVDADLSVSRLNFDPYEPLLGADAKPVDAVLRLLDETEGSVKLAADVVIAEGAELRGFGADLGLAREQGITIRTLKFDDWLGAGLSLSGTAKQVSVGNAARVDLSGAGNGLDLRPLLSAWGFALPAGEAPLGPATYDVKIALADGTGEVTADGYLVGAKAGARLKLDKAEAPLLGKLGTGSLVLDAAVHGQNLAVVGRLFGHDPALTAQGGTPDDNPHPYLAPVPDEKAAIPPGWAFVHLERAPAHYLLNAGAGLPDGALRLIAERTGTGNDGTGRFALSASAPDAAALFGALGVSEERRRPFAGPLSVTLRAEGPANAVAFSDFKIAFGSMQLNGAGKLDLSGARPSFDGAIHGGAIDLDALGALLPLTRGAGGNPWSDRKLDLSVLGAIDLGASVEAQALTLGHLPFQQPKFALALKDGALALDGVKTSLYGGNITANLALRGGGNVPGLGASVKFVAIDGAQLAQTLWGRSFFTGPLAGSFTLSAQGESTAKLAADAQGTLSLKSGAGSVEGLDAKTPEAVTAFTDFALDGPINAGVLAISAGQMKTAGGVVNVAGDVSLPVYTVDLTVTADKKQQHIGGPLDAPARKADVPAPPPQGAAKP